MLLPKTETRFHYVYFEYCLFDKNVGESENKAVALDCKASPQEI